MHVLIRKKHLVLVNVNYFLPDYINLVQEFIWQTEDYVPKLPRVHKFLNYWHKEIDAVINEVSISYSNELKMNYTDYFKEL